MLWGLVLPDEAPPPLARPNEEFDPIGQSWAFSVASRAASAPDLVLYPNESRAAHEFRKAPGGAKLAVVFAVDATVEGEVIRGRGFHDWPEWSAPCRREPGGLVVTLGPLPHHPLSLTGAHPIGPTGRHLGVDVVLRSAEPGASIRATEHDRRTGGRLGEVAIPDCARARTLVMTDTINRMLRAIPPDFDFRRAYCLEVYGRFLVAFDPRIQAVGWPGIVIDADLTRP